MAFPFECPKCSGSNRPVEFPNCIMCDVPVKLCLTCAIQQDVTLCDACIETSRIMDEHCEEIQRKSKNCSMCHVLCVKEARTVCCNEYFCSTCLLQHHQQIHSPLYQCPYCMHKVYNWGKHNRCPHPGCALVYGCKRCYIMRDNKESACYIHGSRLACSVCHYQYLVKDEVCLRIAKYHRYKKFCGECGERIRIFIRWAVYHKIPHDVINHILLKNL